jgi:hypothetical protein
MVRSEYFALFLLHPIYLTKKNSPAKKADQLLGKVKL